MNMRKFGLYLLGSLFVILTVLSFLLPLKSSAAGEKIKPQRRPVESKQQGPPNYDLFASSPNRSDKNGQQSIESDEQQIEGGRAVQTEPRRGVPTFLWASEQQQMAKVTNKRNQTGNVAETAARGYLGGNAARYRLSDADAAAAELVSVHDTGKGAIIVKFRQNIGGIEVFRDEINIIMNRKLQLVAISGYLTSDDVTDGSAAQNFQLQPIDALSKAVRDLTGTVLDTTVLQPLESQFQADTAGKNSTDKYIRFTADNSVLKNFSFDEEPSRVKPVMFHAADSYIPAYYVETSVLVPSINVLSTDGSVINDELAYSYVVSAVDGEILFRNNLISEQANTYSYRVWADPTTKIPFDTPAGNGVHPKINPTPDGAQYPFVAQENVSLQNYPFSRNDPWLPAGATETVGNNADAYVNLINGVSPGYSAATDNGYGPVAPAPYDGTRTVANGGGDFRSKSTAANQFLHTYDAAASPVTAEARQSNIQQLFYNVNFLHDWFYDAGFDEASGNAQTDNFGRGGLGGDSIKAQAQDVSARNNANMATPADGGRPRMRMYIFDTYAPKYLDVLTPADIAGRRSVGKAEAGPQSFDLTNEIIYANPDNGCTPFTNAAAVSGKFAMVQYPTTVPAGCGINTMITNAQNAGAVGFILVWLSSSPTAAVNVTGANAAQTIPFLSISFNNAAGIKTKLANNETVTARMRRDFGNDRDGTIDNQIVFHEWGHYISNRLIGNASGLNTNYARGLGEGWGDFTSMLLTVRGEDTTTASNTNYNGAYALATYATSGGLNGDTNQGYYYGIRRAPYSTDMSKNGLTFKHIQDGTALPAGVLGGGVNSEVHNTGEIWTTMLWECYAAMLRDTLGAAPRLTFQQAQDRMKLYLVAAYKMTPVSPTMLEARDAVIAAAFANDPIDGQLFAQAFAKRGAGVRAVSPDRYSTNNVGVTESFVAGSDVAYIGSVLDDSVLSLDNDNYLDGGERGLLKITIKNTGSSALTATTATVSSNKTSLTYPNGATVNFPTIQPLTSATVPIEVRNNGMSGLQIANFTISLNDPNLAIPGTVTGNHFAYVNVDEVLAATTTDTVEPRQTAWTVSGDTALSNDPSALWRISQTPAVLPGRFWFGPNVGFGSDQYLISPPVTIDGSGSLNMQFDHSWGFEFDANANYDGGVVEMSVNNGAWTDIGAAAYNGTLATGDINPLKGRRAFVKNSAGTVHTSLTQAVAPGSIVKVRFRLGSDSSAGAAGWQVDNIALGGIVEKPFVQLIGEPAVAPTAANVSIGGRVRTQNGRPIRNVIVSVTDLQGNTRTARTGATGLYRFYNVPAGETYVITARAKQYTFSQPSQAVNINEDAGDINFTGNLR